MISLRVPLPPHPSRDLLAKNHAPTSPGLRLRTRSAAAGEVIFRHPQDKVRIRRGGQKTRRHFLSDH